jgi:hypothetical protein
MYTAVTASFLATQNNLSYEHEYLKLPQTALPSLREVDQKCGSVEEFPSTPLTMNQDIKLRP